MTEATPIKSHQNGYLTTVDMLMWMGEAHEASSLEKTTGNQGMLRVGDIELPGKSTQIGYLTPNGWP